jgi:hypothetical protein
VTSSDISVIMVKLQHLEDMLVVCMRRLSVLMGV